MVILKFRGTDAYLMKSFVPHMGWKWKLKTLVNRLVHKLFDKVVQEIIIDHHNLEAHLRAAGFKTKIRVVSDPVEHPRPYDKIPHKGFNVLYYDPSRRPDKKNKEAIRWIYGVDVSEAVMKYCAIDYPHINFIVVDRTADMSKVWPITDFYLRPNRIDGRSRMAAEAVINNIPLYHTRGNPDFFTAINQILHEATKAGY